MTLAVCSRGGMSLAGCECVGRQEREEPCLQIQSTVGGGPAAGFTGATAQLQGQSGLKAQMWDN